MNKNMELENIYYNSLREIDFSTKFKSVVERHMITNHMIKTKSTEVKRIFENLGYKITFKDNSYFLIESLKEYKFQITFQIKLGSVLCYVFVWQNENLLDLEYGHFTFLRNKLENIEEFIAPSFSNYLELEKILKELLKIYEDLKVEFVKQANE